MPHLKDFMRNGKEFTVAVIDPDSGEMVEVPIWIQRPTPIQQEACITKANAAAAKHRAMYRDPDSEESRVVVSQLEELDAGDLIEIITRKEAAELRRQAHEEVLYGEVGSKWDGVDEETGQGHDYFSIIEALADKYDEYQDLAKVGVEMDLDEDPGIKELIALQQQFEGEVDERTKELLQSIDAPWKKKSQEELVKEAMKGLVASNAQMAWYQTYRIWQLFFACRYPEDHKKLYFEDIDDLYDLDEAVRASLMLYYDEVDKGPDHTKASPTPVDSSPSSEQ